VLGDQTEQDLSFVTNAKAFSYAASLFPGDEKVKFSLEYNLSAKGLCHLLDTLL